MVRYGTVREKVDTRTVLKKFETQIIIAVIEHLKLFEVNVQNV
jgi:hypothetical protein